MIILAFFFIFITNDFLEVVRDVEGLLNEATKLPCNIVRFEYGEDRAKLIMWFRNGSETPFYM